MRNIAWVIILFFALGEAFAINPPGTKKVKIDNETLYIDQNEICVADWLEYINSIEHSYGKGSEELKATFKRNTKCANISEYEYRNMLTVASVIVESALERKESRGAHSRSDYRQTNDIAQHTDITKFTSLEKLEYAK